MTPRVKAIETEHKEGYENERVKRGRKEGRKEGRKRGRKNRTNYAKQLLGVSVLGVRVRRER